MRRIGVLLVLGVLGCGETSNESGGSPGGGGTSGTGALGGSGTSATGGEGANGGASGTGGTGGQSINTGATGGTISDAGPADAQVIEDAGWFLCGSCACNGATHYCEEISGGAKAAGTPLDAAACVPDGSRSANDCLPLPAACDGGISCGCIVMPFPRGPCTCTVTGGGVHVSCALP